MDTRSNLFYIAKRISQLIGMTVGIVGTNGEVITSTDSLRVGLVNEGAKYLLQNNQTYYCVNDDCPYAGAAKGAIATLQVEENVFGAVEICGETQSAAQFIHIVKAMCEKMVVDSMKSSNTRSIQERRNQFLRNWLVGGITDKLQFSIESIALGIDRYAPKRCIILRADMKLTDSNRGDRKLLERFESKIHAVCADTGGFPQDLILTSYFKSCIIFQHESKNRCIALGEKLKAVIEKDLGLELCVGIGKPCESDDEMPLALHTAEKACIISQTKNGHPICLYEDVDLDLILQSVPAHAKNDFLKNIFYDYSDDELRGVMDFLYSMYTNNGSIIKVAEEMYLHKNTVQNRILSIKKRTGYDVRQAKEAMPLYTAMLIYMLQEAGDPLSR